MDFSKDAAKSDMLYVKDLSQSGVQHIQRICCLTQKWKN